MTKVSSNCHEQSESTIHVSKRVRLNLGHVRVQAWRFACACRGQEAEVYEGRATRQAGASEPFRRSEHRQYRELLSLECIVDASVGDVRLRGQLEARLTLRKKLSKHRELRALLGVAPSRHGGPARMDLPTCNLQASAERKACEHKVSLLCDEMESLCSNLEFCWGKQISTPKKTSTPKMLSTPKMQNFLGGGGLTPPHP